MSVTGSCGHDITNEPKVMMSIMDFARTGENAVTYGVYCEKCRADYERWGIVLHNKQKEEKWMRGELEYPR